MGSHSLILTCVKMSFEAFCPTHVALAFKVFLSHALENDSTLKVPGDKNMK